MDVSTWIENHQAEFIALSDQIWACAETGYKEERSAHALGDALARAGFEVAYGVADIPTAFVASYGQGKPVIAILGEYDALPGLSQQVMPERRPVVTGGNGHGCGHNLLGVAALAAATVLLIPATISLAIPSIDPYRTSIESARLFDAVLADGEPMVHYRRLRDSALFYADRNAIVLRSPEQLEERIRAPRPFYCLIELERVEEMPWLSECTNIVVREGGKVILWNRVGPEPPRPRGERP